MNSYEFQNDVRDLSEVFKQVIVWDPVLTMFLSETGVAKNTKHEWLEDVVTAKAWAIATAAHVSGDNTITLASSTWVKVWDILWFKKSTGASSTLQVKVTVITGNVLTVSVYWGTTDEDLAIGTSVRLNSRPKNESSTGEADNAFEPKTQYNFTQIFDRTAKVSKTAQSVKMYGIADSLNYQIERQLSDLKYELINAIIYGRRVERSGSEAWTMGWLLNFMEIAALAGADNTVDANGAALSATILNNAFEKWYKNGANNLKVMFCWVKQSRKISAFNTSGANPIITKSESSVVAWNYVSSFVADLPVQGWLVSTIIVDPNFPEDKVLIVDLDRVNFLPLEGRAFQDADATMPGADYFARRILGEYTLEVKNAGNSHVLIEDLAI